MFNIPLYEMFVHVIVGTVFSILIVITHNNFNLDVSQFQDVSLYLYLTIFYFMGLIIERFSSSLFEYVLRKILPKKMKNHKEILKAQITSKRYEIHIRNYAMNRSFIVAFLIILLYTMFSNVDLVLRLQLIFSYIIVITVFIFHSAKLVNKINNYYE